MIVYCVETFPGTEDWANEFFETQSEAKANLKKCTEAELPAKLLKLCIPDTKAGFVELLNLRDANHMNLPVLEQVARNY